jgi:hypothetical protein
MWKGAVASFCDEVWQEAKRQTKTKQPPDMSGVLLEN